jgi:hypothetical protein
MDSTAALGDATTSANGVDHAENVEIPELAGEPRAHRKGGWYTKLVAHYLKRNAARRAAHPAVADARTASERALAAIRWACIKSAISGAAAGSVSTSATIFTAETEGLGAIVAGPIAALAIGGEMVYRSAVHVDLSCELAAIFDVKFDPNDDSDIWRLYALAFGTHQHEAHSDDPGQALVHSVTHTEAEQIGEKIGHKVLGESVMRNIVPVLGIFSSALTNYRMTQKLGDTVRRYMRYQRALDDASNEACVACHAHLDLLIEGIWFVFTADGKLTPEEAAFLAHMLQKLDRLQRHAVLARFVEDELDWTNRIQGAVPEALRDTFLYVLEVAAAVDKEVGLPERKLLRRASLALGREFSPDRVLRMITEFEENGVLSHKAPSSAEA